MVMEDEQKAEQEILNLIARGDDSGFDLMVERYAPMLYRFARRMCGDPTEAEDALQETFLTAQEKIVQFRSEGRLRNWLFKITANACRQKHRQRKGRQERELKLEEVLPVYSESTGKEPVAWQLNPVEQMLSDELAARLEAAIARIPATNRSVLVLRDLEGLSTRETAAALEITEEAVKVRLHRARAYLRNLLRDYFEEKE